MVGTSLSAADALAAHHRQSAQLARVDVLHDR
jgi:hypothetical protein